MKCDGYLLLDSCLACCYAASRWIESFSQEKQFKGIGVRENVPSPSILQRRKNFHTKHAGVTQLTEAMCEELTELYQGLDETEKAMIHLAGIPKYSISSVQNTIFLGHDINGSKARKWMMSNSWKQDCILFTHLGQILHPWWFEWKNTRILNVHSAVLPYARGMYSIENIAATQDLDLFRRAAGITIHYMDRGVDTGPIIRAERIRDPFRFDSIWELKGYTYLLGYRLYLDTAKHILFDSETMPVGVVGDPQLRGTNFRTKDWTEEQKRRAVEGYLGMKRRSATGV